LAHDDHGAMRVAYDVVGHRTEERSLQPAASAGADHNGGGTLPGGEVTDGRTGCAFEHCRLRVVATERRQRQPHCSITFGQGSGAHLVELVLRHRRACVTAAAVEVDGRVDSA